MKKYVFFFIAIINVFSFSCLAQGSAPVLANSKKENTVVVPENLANKEGYIVVSYHVVEKIGGNITTYDVSSLSLIDKNNLGPNNSRVVTPKYGKAKVKRKGKTIVGSEAETKAETQSESKVVADVQLQEVAFDTKINTEKMISQKESFVPPVKKLTFITVDLMSTYERILEKEYESVDLLKKVADNRYFKGELKMAYKWYSQLFRLTTDLEIAYYYRYAQVLRYVGQINRSKEMLEIFESKKKLK